MTTPTKSEKPTIIQTGLTNQALADRITQNVTTLHQELKKARTAANFQEAQHPTADSAPGSRATLARIEAELAKLDENHRFQVRRPTDAAASLSDWTGKVWTANLLRKVALRLSWLKKVANEDEILDRRFVDRVQEQMGRKSYYVQGYTNNAMSYIVKNLDECWAIANRKENAP